MNTVNIEKPLLPHFKAASRDPQKIIAFFKEHPEIDVDAEDEKQNTALHFACWSGKLQNAQYLLDLGADLHHPNYRGNTPLINWFEKSQDPDVVFKWINQYGLPENMTFEGQRNYAHLLINWLVTVNVNNVFLSEDLFFKFCHQIFQNFSKQSLSKKDATGVKPEDHILYMPQIFQNLYERVKLEFEIPQTQKIKQKHRL